MDFYEELQKLTVDEYQSFQEKDLSSSGSENLEKEIVKAFFPSEEKDGDDLMVSNRYNSFGDEDNNIQYSDCFQFDRKCDEPQIKIEKHQLDSSSTNPYSQEISSQNQSELFVINRPKKKGRKKKEHTSLIIYEINVNNEVNVHSKSKRDNLIKKIKCKIFRFIILLINDCLLKEINQKTIQIKEICKKVTSNISIKYNVELLKQKILFILCNNPISAIYINEKDKYFNKRIVEKITNELKEKTPLTNELLNFTFEQFYHMYIYDKKEDLIDKYGLKKSKNFNDYISELREKKNYEEDYLKILEKESKNFLSFFNIARARRSRKKNDE